MRMVPAILAILLLAAAALADEIRLTGGQVIVGRIVEQNSAFVTIETMVHGNRATLTYSRRQIRSITRGEIPDSFFDPPEAEPATGTTEAPPETEPDAGGDPEPAEAPGDAVRYMEIPLKGGVGREITARGVRDAIRLAKRQRLDAVVFVLDTEGGLVMDADAIARVMEEERSEMKYYALVRQAISAGIWPLSRSDRIFFEPGGVAGAATAFSVGTGHLEIDAKFNAAVAAGLAAAAEARGQSGQIYRAMVLMDATLHQWTDEQGVTRLTGSAPPAAAVESIELVSRTEVLAMTAVQADELGFATLLPRAGSEAIGEVIGEENWENVGPIGGRVMVAAQREIERRIRAREDAQQRVLDLRQEVVDLANRAPRLHQAALNADPSRIRVYYREGSRTLTADSQMRWRRQTDEAVARWNDFQHLLGRIRSVERNAERALDHFNNCIAREWEARLYDEEPEPLELPPVDHGLDLDQLHREVESKKQELRSRRMRSTLDR